MVELLIFIIGIAALIAFWSTFKKAGNAIDSSIDLGLNAINVVARTSQDSMDTYAQKVTVANYRTREQTSAEIDELEEVHSVKSLEEKLEALIVETQKKSRTSKQG